MSSIEVYAFEDADGNPDEFTTMDAREAKSYAIANNRKWIARQYEYADSELVEDYTETDDDEINPDDPPVEATECRYCLKYIPRDREDVSPFCSEECREEWEASHPKH